MEALVELIVFLLALAFIVGAMAALGGAIIAAGYYFTFTALGLVTAIALGIWGVVYYRAPYRQYTGRWNLRQPKSEILFRGYVTGIILLIMWIIAFFANWSGTGVFFDSIVNFFIRSGS